MNNVEKVIEARSNMLSQFDKIKSRTITDSSEVNFAKHPEYAESVARFNEASDALSNEEFSEFMSYTIKHLK